MERLLKQDLLLRYLHDVPGVHHVDPISHLLNHAETVGDEDDRGRSLLDERVEQTQHLGLNRHVERGGRLVGNHQLRFGCQCHRNADPLPHPSRQLNRIAGEHPIWIGELDVGQGLDRPTTTLLLVHLLRCRVANDRSKLITDREDWIQRRNRILEDHRDAAAADSL